MHCSHPNPKMPSFIRVGGEHEISMLFRLARIGKIEVAMVENAAIRELKDMNGVSTN
jgi:hypothetical protein